MELSIVIPAYMEEENLRLLLPRLKKVLDDAGLTYEILVVDTAAALDDTEGACRQAGAVHLRRAGGDSFGAAVRTGIANTQGKYVCFMDADGSHGPEFITQMLHWREQFDVVVASRYVDGGHTENSPMLVLMSRMLNWTYAFFLNLNCQDVSNSFKLYRGEELRNIELKCDNFDIVEEILIRLARRTKQLRIKELPFTFKQRMFGKSKRNLFVFIFSYGVTLIRLLRIR